MTRGAASYFFMGTMHRILFLLLIGWLGASNEPANGQAYFNKRYANPIVGEPLGFGSVAPTGSGYVAAGDATNFPTPGLTSLALYFLDSTGQQRRTRFVPDANIGAANSVYQLADGGYIVAAQRISPVFPFPGVTLLCRFTPAGDTLWTRRWRRARAEDALSMCVLPDGGFAVAGALAVGANSSAGIDFLLTRTDANGNIRWWQAYNNLLQDVCYSIAPTPDGGFLIGGYSYDRQQYDAFVVKTDSLGTEQWRRTFGAGALDDGIACVTALRDGNYAVGVSIGTGGTPGTPWVLRRSTIYKLDAQGQILWQRAYGPSREVSGVYSLHELPDGSLVAAGQQADGTAAQSVEAIALKLCPDGDSLWLRSYKMVSGPNSNNYLRDLRPTADGGFVAGGFIHPSMPDTGRGSGWVFRLDSAGHLLAGGPPVARRCQLVGVDAPRPVGTGVEVWPNPATTGVYVRVAADRPQPAGEIRFYDALGRLCHHAPLPATHPQIPISLRGLRPGLYCYVVQLGEATAQRGTLLVQP